MSDAEILAATFRDVLDLTPGVDLSAVRYGSPETWDSVAHMELITAIETAFGVEVQPDDIPEMASYRAAVRVLHQRYGLVVG